MSKKIFIHIGYPKCLSTTLQRDFFDKHPDITFGGTGVSDNVSYINDDIEFIFESLLKYANHHFWLLKRDEYKKKINQFIESSQNEVIVFSSEYLAMPITIQEIDSYEKLLRIHYLFSGYDVRFIMIKRDPIALIRSFYREYIRLGYYETYAHYLSYLIIYKDRSFLYDLDYNQKQDFIEQIFGLNSVSTFEFEQLKLDARVLINKNFSELLQITNLDLPIHFNNKSLSDSAYYALMVDNKLHQRGMGKSIIEPFEKHRNRVLIRRGEILFAEQEIYDQVVLKRLAISQINLQKNNNSNQLFSNSTHLENIICEIINCNK